MKELKTLLTRDELAERWGYTKTSIVRLEQDGVIHRVKGLQGCKYSIREIEKIEMLGRSDLEEISLIDYKRMEIDRDKWKNEYLKLRNAISTSAYDLVKVLSDGGKYD